jgi:hypothetical protein
MNCRVFQLLFDFSHQDLNLLHTPTKRMFKKLWRVGLNNLELLNDLVLAKLLEP